MNICVNEIKLLSKNFLVCKFNVSEKLKKYFNEYEFFIEFNYDISSVPQSILAIPLLSTLMPIAWFTGATVLIDSIDKEFYESLDTIKNAFGEMYPTIKLNGGIKAKNIVENQKTVHSTSPIVLFSGGLDSIDSFIRHKGEKPYLATVWGADIFLDKEVAWEIVKNDNSQFAKKYELENIFIKSNFRRFINYYNLGKLHKEITEWWGQIQHGMGLIGLCAPVSFSLGIDKIFIPATHSPKFRIPWGSCPEIDNNLKWAQTKVIHDGFEFTRQNKIANLAEYIKTQSDNIQLRVCWESAKGYNCGKCEKCWRTISGLIVEGLDPKDVGFSVFNENDLKMAFQTGKWKFGKNLLFIWNDIQDRLKVKGIDDNSPYKDYLLWFSKSDFNNFYKRSKLRNFLRVSKLRRILRVIKYKTLSILTFGNIK